ncbi:AAA family ATPase [Kitasatospora sp. RG8]|uniref:helix-turn-helix transcriptional regulator n=1 Tax=Kitasatospora sp. RG8 TaxID=2820815 RepID=UPI001AE0BC27|nr:LuxR family transcriptional regulator [Kitasatospora sp. RG8]MBP0448706.1 AAA family ATPase [Kitasatospora sp. RG8]
MRTTRPGAAPIGRTTESLQLAEVLSGAADGRGRAVLLRGEAGIGKSTLLRACADRARETGFAVLRGTANESEQRLPLGTFLDVLERDQPYSGELRAEYRAAVATSARHTATGMTDPVSAAVERLFHVVARQCSTSPVLVVVDDLQWADEISATLWTRLAHHAERLPLMVAAAVTPGTGGEAEAPAAKAMRSCGGLIVDLGPLAPDDAAALATRQLGGPAGPTLLAALGRAGGNPLHLTELTALLHRQGALAMGVHGFEISPDRRDLSLEAAITDRLQRLSTELRAALRIAALLGAEFRPADLAAVSRRPLVALLPVLEEALAAAVLDPAGERLRFRHQLIRQALVTSVPTALRGALHRQTAEALDLTGAPLDQVAGHLVQATSVAADAWLHGWVACHARELVTRSPATALELLTRADAGTGREADRTGRQLRMAEALTALGRPHEAEVIVRRLLAAPSVEPEVAAEASWLLGEALYARSPGTGALEAAALLASASRTDGISERSRARLRAEGSFYLLRSDRLDEAAEAAVGAVAMGGRSGETFAVAYATWIQTVIARVRDGDLSGAVELSERGLALCVDGAHPRAERLLRTQRLVIAGLHDRISEADTEITRLRRLGASPRTHGQHTAVAIAAHLFRTGQWDEALAEIEHLAESEDLAGEELPPVAVQVHGLAALVAGLRDDTSTCEARLRLVRDHPLHTLADPGAPQWLVMARSIAAERAGRPDRALAALLPVLDREVATGPVGRSSWLPAVVRLALAVGDRATAETAAAAAGTGTVSSGAPGIAYWQHTARHAAGLLEADPAPLLEAAGYYAASSRPLRRANALEDAAELLARQGCPAEARRRLDEAVAVYTGLGAAWGIRRAQARLRAAGLHLGARGPRPRAASGWQSLTPTELRVAQGIADSRSNPEIAAELMLSTRTVQTHVSHILAKLSFRSRVEIAAEAARQSRVRRKA